MIDRLRMFEVITNLLRNAIKYSDDKKEGSTKTILVFTSKTTDGKQVLVSIRDEGTGIDPNMLPRLFTKFSTDRERGGTGLGLFIAKNIVEAHGGKIWAENNADGNGATFSFSIPLLNTS
jgi:signal transduction histidine kinase